MGWQAISGATSPIYTPTSATFDDNNDALNQDGTVNTNATPEVGYCLRATVTYTDNIFDASGTTAQLDHDLTSGHY